MLLRFFRVNGAQNILFIPLIGIILWLGVFFHTPAVSLLSDKLQLPLYESMFGYIASLEFLQSILAFLLVLSIAFLLVRLNTRFIIINNRTYLPALIYVLIVSGIPDIQKLNPALIVTFIILFIVEIILESYRFDKLFYGFFTAAFLLGLGCLFYPFFYYFLFTLWAGVILLRKFSWREWVFTFMGFSIPFLFAFSYYYVLYDQPLVLINNFSQFYKSNYDFTGFSPQVYVFLGTLGFLTIVASQFLMQVFSARKILSRRAFSVLFWLFLNTVGVFFLVEQASVELIYIAAIPLSFLLANYWVFVKSVFWGNLLLTMLLFIVLFNQVSHYLF